MGRSRLTGKIVILEHVACFGVGEEEGGGPDHPSVWTVPWFVEFGSFALHLSEPRQRGELSQPPSGPTMLFPVEVKGTEQPLGIAHQRLFPTGGRVV